ncbi:HAD family hydrolase [Caulobacter sp. KR2-114]|uniref:HAD family hydrolase n=1 Tax=Caulobacter sp. KR2-114 TaxID=3400912 RepID=UPI003C1007A4
MTARALMMDVDGVLVTRLRPGWRWDADMEADLGVKPDDLQQAFFARYFRPIVLGQEPLEPWLAKALAEIAPHVTAQRMMAYWFEKDAVLDHQLLADLEGYRARGIELHLATIQEHNRATHLWEALRFKDRFDGLHHSAAVGFAKPDPDYYAATQRRVGLPAAELLLVDDSERNVEAALAAGWQARHWTGERRLAEVLGF